MRAKGGRGVGQSFSEDVRCRVQMESLTRDRRGGLKTKPATPKAMGVKGTNRYNKTFEE